MRVHSMRRLWSVPGPAGSSPSSSGFVMAPQAGHSVYWEQPDVFKDAILGFIGNHQA